MEIFTEIIYPGNYNFLEDIDLSDYNIDYINCVKLCIKGNLITYRENSKWTYDVNESRLNILFIDVDVDDVNYIEFSYHSYIKERGDKIDSLLS